MAKYNLNVLLALVGASVALSGCFSDKTDTTAAPSTVRFEKLSPEQKALVVKETHATYKAKAEAMWQDNKRGINDRGEKMQRIILTAKEDLTQMGESTVDGLTQVGEATQKGASAVTGALESVGNTVKSVSNGQDTSTKK